MRRRLTRLPRASYVRLLSNVHEKKTDAASASNGDKRGSQQQPRTEGHIFPDTSEELGGCAMTKGPGAWRSTGQAPYHIRLVGPDLPGNLSSA
ncbi:hypothetical protein NDU88_002522 [Pleurodeles waltl]|uniref:Uncharacterized protein n=1 Tax=Pleurodeles waltl TaxID=8319 RepID=A0AAV7UA24_PLEWA|nr:hypothetical protein NDU88_002522 [Pleurodeles waltl]